ncbi:MAG: hypothetical protein DHS80DRAFT_23074 [Piptocephalis tieghemiana]|nr:MAG: hypothetical protein DHS80DRAFT_23074 [Piptocephalis tieghemiana]
MDPQALGLQSSSPHLFWKDIQLRRDGPPAMEYKGGSLRRSGPSVASSLSSYSSSSSSSYSTLQGKSPPETSSFVKDELGRAESTLSGRIGSIEEEHEEGMDEEDEVDEEGYPTLGNPLFHLPRRPSSNLSPSSVDSLPDMESVYSAIEESECVAGMENLEFYPLLYCAIIGNTILTPLPLDIRTILSIGSLHSGWVTRVAAKYPKSRITIHTALDRMGMEPEKARDDRYARLEFTERRAGDYRLPFADASFDCVHQHGIAEDIVQSAWPEVIKEFWRVMTIGAYLELVEPDPYLQGLGKYGKIIGDWVKNVAARMELVDQDHFLRLPTQLRQSGFAVVESQLISCPVGAWGGWIGRIMEGMYRSRLISLKGIILGLGLCEDGDEFDQICNLWTEELRHTRTWRDVWIYTARKKDKRSGSVSKMKKWTDKRQGRR